VAIGIGANCAICTVADALLLRPLPVARPGEIVTVGSMNRLERARGEIVRPPALRNLSNAARMVERHPQVLQLRLMQVAGQQPGTTLVVGMPNGSFPVRAATDHAQPGAAPDAPDTDSDV
jgi:hypothetical protein